MSDKPTPVNGKRNQSWGTTTACPACGECLCFGCHPDGPCVDEQESPSAMSGARLLFGGWTPSTEADAHVSHLRP